MKARLALGAIGIITVAVGIFALRAETMSRETAQVRADVDLVVEFKVEAKLLHSYELPTVASSIFNACRLQAEAGFEQPLRRVGDNRFRAVLSPAPNETDRKQLAGCLSDLMLAHTRSGDVQMYERQSDQA